MTEPQKHDSLVDVEKKTTTNEHDNKMWLFYIDGGYNFDPKTGTTVAGGRYFWNPGKEWLGSLADGEELASMTSRSDDVLRDQYVIYPYSLTNINKAKCVVSTCLHLLMRHPGKRFCFVTDVADAIERNLAKVVEGRRKLGSETMWRSLWNLTQQKEVKWIQCEVRSKLELDLKRQDRIKRHQHRAPAKPHQS